MTAKLPFSEEAEKSVLGSILIDKDCIFSVMELIEPSDFHIKKNQYIFEVMQELVRNGNPIDVVTLSNKFKGCDKYKTIEISYITELINIVPSSISIKAYCAVVKEKSQARKTINLCEKTIEATLKGEKNSLNTLIAEIVNTTGEIKNSYSLNANELAHEYFERVMERQKQGGIDGIPYGFTYLDRATRGAKKSNLILIAGRPSQGKSAFLDNIFSNMLEDQRKVFFISAESSRQEIMDRVIGRMSLIGHNKLMEGLKEEDNQYRRFSNAIGKFAEYGDNVTINDNPAITTEHIYIEAMKLKLQGRLDVILVDYIQFLKDYISGNNEAQRIAKISKSLKTIARELQVPVIAAAQFNRNAKEGEQPSLSDLRESGQLEQDADLVLGLWREKAEDIYSDITNFRILKQRNGGLLEFKLKFNGMLCKFENL